MSTNTSQAPGSETLELFTAGERFAVDPNAIERELAAVWREAGRSTEGGHPVTRACLWNVIVHVEARPEQASPSRFALEDMVKGLPRHLAARSLVLRTHPHGGPEIRSWISANCILDDSGSKLVCSEEITLESSGEGWRHLPALVRALLVPGVPTAVVFGSVPDSDAPLASALMQAADRIIVHTAACGEQGAFGFAERLRGGRTLSDLGWTAQAELRRAIASTFDDVPNPELHRVEARVGLGCSGDALLAMAWIASCLNPQDINILGENSARLLTKHGSIELSIVEGPEHEGLCLYLDGSGGRRTVCLELDGVVRIEGMDGIYRRAGSAADEAALLARTLLSTAESLDFRKALRWARELSK